MMSPGPRDRLSSGILPMCTVIENNHVAHVPYPRALAQGTPPSRDIHIATAWDRYRTFDFVNQVSRQDFISRFNAICKQAWPESMCPTAR